MLPIHPQFLKDISGDNAFVVLTINEFNCIIEQLEEVEDVRLYDEVKKRKQVFIDMETAFVQIEAKRKKE